VTAHQHQPGHALFGVLLCRDTAPLSLGCDSRAVDFSTSGRDDNKQSQHAWQSCRDSTTK
jgi:hypothetical protein